jgi:hypothetical protein
MTIFSDFFGLLILIQELSMYVMYSHRRGELFITPYLNTSYEREVLVYMSSSCTLHPNWIYLGYVAYSYLEFWITFYSSPF